MSIQLKPEHFKLVSEILRSLQIEAHVFGSRSKESAKELSDLDLCLKKTYDKTKIRKLQDAFEESDLPFKVDVIQWSEISDDFKSQIKADLILFPVK